MSSFADKLVAEIERRVPKYELIALTQDLPSPQIADPDWDKLTRVCHDVLPDAIELALSQLRYYKGLLPNPKRVTDA